jgi:hypothetical protein
VFCFTITRSTSKIIDIFLPAIITFLKTLSLLKLPEESELLQEYIFLLILLLLACSFRCVLHLKTDPNSNLGISQKDIMILETYFRNHVVRSEDIQEELPLIEEVKEEEEDETSLFSAEAFAVESANGKLRKEWKNLLQLIPCGVALSQGGDCLREKNWSYCNNTFKDILQVSIDSEVTEALNKLYNKHSPSINDYPSTESFASQIDFDSRKTCFFVKFPTMYSAIKESKSSKNVIQSRFLLSKEDEKDEVTIEVTAKKIIWGERQAILFLFMDVSEMKMLEDDKIGNKVKMQILSSLSHELKTPIHCILNALLFCKGNLLKNPEALTNVIMAINSSNFLLNKFNDVLVINLKLSLNNLIRIM